MSAYQSIKVSLIDIPEGRLRDVDQDWAECLAGMFQETGHKTPIDVVAAGKRFSLVAGAHRLTAAKHLKWKEIEARILEPQSEQVADELRLYEILENLGRKNFNALERCEALSELKRVYEALNPDTKNGGDRRSKAAKQKQENQNAIFAFCSSASETTGLSRRSVELAVQIFQGLSPESRERLKGTDYAQKQANLKALSEMDAEAQKKVLDLLVADPTEETSTSDAGPDCSAKVSSIADAKALADGKKVASETEKRFSSVSSSLLRLPEASRNAVYRQNKDEIMALAKREGWLDE